MDACQLKNPEINFEFVHEGHWLLSAGVDGTARLWDPQSGKVHRRFAHRRGDQPWVYPRLSPDGKIFVTCGKNIHCWNVETGKELPWSPAKNPGAEAFQPGGMRFTADGRTLYLWGAWHEPNSSHGILESWDVATGKRTKQFVLPYGFVLAPDCKTYLFPAVERFELRAVDGGKVLHRWAGTVLNQAVFSADGKFLTALDFDSVVVWDLADGKEKYRLRLEHPDCGHDFPPEMRETAYKLFDTVLAGK